MFPFIRIIYTDKGLREYAADSRHGSPCSPAQRRLEKELIAAVQNGQFIADIEVFSSPVHVKEAVLYANDVFCFW